jgi:hypothetical protein
MIQTDLTDLYLPVFYFTELLLLALTQESHPLRLFRKHVTDPVPLLKHKGLLP